MESLEDMKYLTDCVRETLRMYPPLTCLMREVLTPFQVVLMCTSACLAALLLR